MKVLVLSAYDAVSHKLWRQRLQECFPQWGWTSLDLPPRHFSWRLRSNGVYWAYNERETLQGDFDLLICTSMVDLATLRGLAPRLSQIPTIVYFHENQFAYPANGQRRDNIEPLLVPLFSAFCADRVLFNSEYNRRTFIEGARSLSKSLPEPFPEAALNGLETSRVIPVPLPDLSYTHEKSSDPNVLELLWNHRWEYDKGPDLLLSLIRKLLSGEQRVKVHIVGQQFRQQPPQFDEIRNLLKDSEMLLTGAMGFISDRAVYNSLLSNCDVVLSTALHDFQGLAIQEACQAGCTPVAPNALAYPEYLPEEYLYQVAAETESTAHSVATRITQLAALKQSGENLPKVDLAAHSQESIRASLQTLVAQMQRAIS